MKNKVVRYMREQDLLIEDSTVLVGVSGGPDSMALLHLLVSLRDEWNLRLVALTVDHQLRGEQSREDVVYVKEIAKKWQVELVETSIDVEEYMELHRVSKQVASRRLRYDFFREQMDRYQADYLTLGHHADDQIETMLMSFTRSASPQAFLGIPLSRDFAGGKILRPLLSVTREEIEAYCGRVGIEPRFDPSNVDTEDMRVYFRKKLVPLLKSKNPNLPHTIQQLSKTFYEDHFFLMEEADKMLEDLVSFSREEKRVSFNIKDYKAYSKSLQRRAFHLILNYLYSDKLPKDISYIHEEDFFSLINESQGSKTLHFPKGLRLERSYEVVSFYFKSEKKDDKLLQTISIPGAQDISPNLRLVADFSSTRKERDKYTYYCPVDGVKEPLILRTRQGGDRIRWKGLKGSKRLSQLFIDEKVPRSKRDSWPIVVDAEGTVLWVVGLKKGLPKLEGRSDLWIKLQVRK